MSQASYSTQAAAEAEYRRRQRQREQQQQAPLVSRWEADRGVYVNRESGRAYQPHHDAEAAWVADETSRYLLAKGGEGSGKSVAGVIKGLEKLRRGMSGIMGSPDFEHFKRSLWIEFRRWCPPDALIPKDRRKLSVEWEPHQPFILTFVNGAILICGGFENPISWEGPNVSWAHFDEARRHKKPSMVKVLDGRIRIPGPRGEAPQLWLTTTPAKHWMFEMFGPWERPEEVDPYADFKQRAHVVDLFTIDNERAGHLAAGYTADRRRSLTEGEARVLLDAAWEDIDDVDRFLPAMALWDACLRPSLPPLTPHTQLIGAADAGVTNDCFAFVAVSRHGDLVVPRLCRIWVPRGGRPLDFDAIEADLRAICAQWNLVHLAYDAYQLHQMMSRLMADGVVWTKAFSQGGDRLVADKQLLDLIMQRRLAHDGSLAELRQHVENADRKVDPESRQIRLVKRSLSQKIDAAVALSMASARARTLAVED